MDLPAHTYLDQRRIPYRRMEFPPDTAKGAASVAHTLGYDEGQVVKTLLFQTSAGQVALVMVGGDGHVLSGLLKRALASRNIRLANLDLVKEVTGYEVGSIPPFHWQPPGFRSLLDVALTAYPELGVGAGLWGHEILITPDDLIAASNAEVVNLTRRDP